MADNVSYSGLDPCGTSYFAAQPTDFSKEQPVEYIQERRKVFDMESPNSKRKRMLRVGDAKECGIFFDYGAVQFNAAAAECGH